MPLVPSIHQGLGDLCVGRTFLKKEEGKTELGRERERRDRKETEGEAITGEKERV